MICNFELPFSLKGTEKIHSFNSSLYLLFSMRGQFLINENTYLLFVSLMENVDQIS